MRALAGGMPRRFKDHRTQVALVYREAYRAIAERYPPKDRLASRLTAMAADLLLDYERLRRSPRAKDSARRKAAGILLGAIRAAAGASNGHGQDGALDLAGELARQGIR